MPGYFVRSDHHLAAPFRSPQEEVQYKVFSALGLDDVTIRSWFNGPAFLTWSRGQNEYGNCIAGPLPRSWMQSQWDLQRQILTRYRSLGIVSQLPGFQVCGCCFLCRSLCGQELF